jgi:hypothetical protein
MIGRTIAAGVNYGIEKYKSTDYAKRVSRQRSIENENQQIFNKVVFVFFRKKKKRD